MKILFVTNVNPFTASFGAEQRSYVFLKSFLQNGCNVDVAYVGLAKENKSKCPSGVNIVLWNDGHHWQFSKLKYYMRVFTVRMYPSSDELETIIDRLVNNNHYDYIACRYLPTAAFAGLFKYANRLLLDIDDMPEPAMAAQMVSCKWYHEIYHKLMLRSVRHETYRWINKVKACFLPNKSMADKNHCIFLPNIPVFHSDDVIIDKTCKNILFIGLMNFRPNYEGINHFITHCWCQIIKAVPAASLYIAGKGLSDELRQKWLSYPNVHLLGFVDSVPDFYSRGNIVIAPVYSGAGTNIKVIEALAFGKATVISPFSAKGYETILINGQNTYIAKTDREYVDRLVSLLRSSELTENIAKAGHIQAVKFYSQDSINRIIKKIIKNNIRDAKNRFCEPSCK